MNKIKNIDLFEKICTCGTLYENCTNDLSQCKEFQQHKKEAIKKSKQKLSNGKI